MERLRTDAELMVLAARVLSRNEQPKWQRIEPAPIHRVLRPNNWRTKIINGRRVRVLDLGAKGALESANLVSSTSMVGKIASRKSKRSH